MFTFLIFLLLIPVFLFFVSVILLPFHFTAYSIFNIFTVPRELIRIFSNKNLRINHALEHATINVMEEEYGQFYNLDGYAREDGFVIRGNVPPRLIRFAAEIGLDRLKKGECNLVVHRRCGTTVAIVNFISSIIFLIFLFRFGMFNLVGIIIALILASLAGPILGGIVQRFLTTSCDVQGMEIIGIEERAVLFGPFPREYIIYTRNLDYGKSGRFYEYK